MKDLKDVFNLKDEHIEAREDNMANLIGQSFGHYHILEQLGEGGMATVYKAYDTRLERDVAIKVIRRNALPQEQLERIRQRFEREAKALAKLSHPNIVGVIDYGEYDGAPYLVLEYLPGGTLKKWMKGSAIPWQEAVRLLIPIANALGYAHEQNIIHRDVKPANILLTIKGEPMLSDFGIAKILEMEDGHTLTGTGVGLGTPEYMSPEQGLGKEVDARADIYSLGVMMYEMLTGRKPFRADTPMAVIVKHINEPLPRPSQYVLGLPVAVENIVLKALAKKPENRYQNMGKFVSAMRGLIANRTLKPNQIPLGSKRTITEDIAAGSRLPARMIGWLAMGVLAIVSLVGFIGWMVIPLIATPTPVITNTILSRDAALTSAVETIQVEITQTSTEKITDTPFPTITPTFTSTVPPPSATITPTAAPGIGDIITSEADSMFMVYVPEGDFTMGSYDGGDDEKPVHTVYLDAYWIDQNEVTNKQYTMCVSSGGCTPPSNNSSNMRSSYYGNTQFDEFPVVYVSWEQANAYCSWAGRELPTEAQWEKAASWDSQNRIKHIYPWGDNLDCSFANYYDTPNGKYCFGNTTAVKKYESGKSPYGAYDMAGNVWEWVKDWYGGTYYQNSPSLNPLGPESGGYHVMRGGSWFYLEFSVRSTIRKKAFDGWEGGDYVGFRCARSVP